SHGFGPGAKAVKKYILEIEALGNDLSAFTPEACTVLRNHLKDAQKAAAGNDTARRRIDFLRMGLELTSLTAAANRMAVEAEQGKPVDKDEAREILDRRWILMRHIFRTYPMAVNVAVVAANNGRNQAAWRKHLGWKGPSEDVKQRMGNVANQDDWLHEDQTDWADAVK
ncbi:MAG: hypothetical protein K9N51_03510, partial [Candidatus Pacebacteria bacterium]|nr:hypothetical protein [Candidatus Paceibacterota bacterium]